LLFFQAEDGIRALIVTGVQTCALPIYLVVLHGADLHLRLGGFFILFYPMMEEAAEAQVKICTMQYNQIEKADRDPQHALRAEDRSEERRVGKRGGRWSGRDTNERKREG